MTQEQAQAELVSMLAAICAQRFEREVVQPLREAWGTIKEWLATYLQELAEAIRNVFATLSTAKGGRAQEDVIDDMWDDDSVTECCEYCGAELDDGVCGICNPFGDCSKCGDPLEWYDGELICKWCDWGID